MSVLANEKEMSIENKFSEGARQAGGNNIRVIPPHGGYRKLRSFQVAELVYDGTVVFCMKAASRSGSTRHARRCVAQGSFNFSYQSIRTHVRGKGGSPGILVFSPIFVTIGFDRITLRDKSRLKTW